MPQNPEWTFERSTPMGGAAGEAFSNILASSGMHPAGVLAREAIQNSVDAKVTDDAKVSVSFRFKLLAGADKAEFAKASGISNLVPRYQALNLNEPNCLQTLSDTDAGLPVLFIDDRATTGLEGDPKDPDSKFYKFLLSLGDGGKEHQDHKTGGSYGYGKSVYSSSSAIRTIFAYSRSRDDKGEERSLLFGCGYFRKHKEDGTHFTGRAWFGCDETAGPNAQQVVAPLTGANADGRAAQLGFGVRSSGDLGTSVMIVDTNIDPEGVLKGVEDWWWPRIVDHLLDVEVVRTNGTAEFPRPKKRRDLKPYLDAYEIAVGRAPATAKTELKKQFNKMDDTSLGVLSLKLLDREEDGSYIVGDDKVDSVALIRSPLMVVAYHRQWQTQPPGVVGVFLADDDIDNILRSAEPPDHHRWDNEANRLQEPTGFNRKVVERVLRLIKQHLKAFQTNASPPPPPKPKRLSILERTLASFLSASKSGTQQGPEHGATPISLAYELVPTLETAGNEQLTLGATFAVQPKADYDGDALQLKVKATCAVIEDGQVGDALPMTTTCSIETDESDGWSIIEVGPGEVARFVCKTEPYDSAWTVRFIPEVQSVEAAA